MYYSTTGPTTKPSNIPLELLKFPHILPVKKKSSPPLFLSGATTRSYTTELSSTLGGEEPGPRDARPRAVTSSEAGACVP